MPLEKAKCPSCGADIQVPNNQDDSFCAYCGARIKAQAALAYYQVQVTGKVEVDGILTIAQLHKKAQQAFDAKQYVDALNLWQKACDIDPTDCGSLVGLAKTMIVLRNPVQKMQDAMGEHDFITELSWHQRVIVGLRELNKCLDDLTAYCIDPELKTILDERKLIGSTDPDFYKERNLLEGAMKSREVWRIYCSSYRNKGELKQRKKELEKEEQAARFRNAKAYLNSMKKLVAFFGMAYFFS